MYHSNKTDEKTNTSLLKHVKTTKKPLYLETQTLNNNRGYTNYFHILFDKLNQRPVIFNKKSIKRGQGYIYSN